MAQAHLRKVVGALGLGAAVLFGSMASPASGSPVQEDEQWVAARGDGHGRHWAGWRRDGARRYAYAFRRNARELRSQLRHQMRRLRNEMRDAAREMGRSFRARRWHRRGRV